MLGDTGFDPDRHLDSRVPGMQRVLALARGVATTPATVLLTGESGTGKEVLARQIHDWSTRRQARFVAINCGAVPSTLVESELFGHEKGAFSGAGERRLGHFEVAHRGTLLLDEISELPTGLQTKLLRVLQEREVLRIGSSTPVSVDVRVIATTNRDLERQVARGRFRQDLYYRLNVFPLHVPPLRERMDDIHDLTSLLLRRLCARFGRLVPRITDAAMARLTSWTFPGNVRELKNVLERALILSATQGRPMIDAPDIVIDRQPEATRSELPGNSCLPGSPSEGVNVTLKELEQAAILQVLEECDGNRTRASERLGISVRTLRNRLREYRSEGINVPEPPGATAS